MHTVRLAGHVCAHAAVVLTQLLNSCPGLQVLKGTHVNAVITREQTELQVQLSSPHVIDSTHCP